MPQSDSITGRWEGSQFVYHSLAHINREICRELVANPFIELEVIPYENNDFEPVPDSPLAAVAQCVGRKLSKPAQVHIRHQWPPNFNAPQQGKWVLVQPWEFGGLPAEWLTLMRDRVDEVWVYTNWVKDCYVASGIPAQKVAVIPAGVDTDLYTPEGPTYPFRTTKRFKFLYLGGPIERKGIDILVNTYLKTFTGVDDVCLVIKGVGVNTAYRNNPIHNQLRDLEARTKQNPKLAAIEYNTDSVSDSEIAAMYRSCNALVSPYRGEGFGMPIAEAMATGLPVIATGAGSCLDFCSPDNSFLLSAGQMPIEPSKLGRSTIGYWFANPDPNDLARWMRFVMEHPAQAKQVGARGRNRIVESFQWKHVAQKVLERISILSKGFPVRTHATHEFEASVKPLELSTDDKYCFFHHPEWNKDHWKMVITSFAKTFSSKDPVRLMLWMDPKQGYSESEIGTAIMEELTRANIDANTTAEITLIPNDFSLSEVAALYAAADCIVPHGSDIQAARAHRMNKTVLQSFSDWRKTAGLHPSVLVQPTEGCLPIG